MHQKLFEQSLCVPGVRVCVYISVRVYVFITYICVRICVKVSHCLAVAKFALGGVSHLSVYAIATV